MGRGDRGRMCLARGVRKDGESETEPYENSSLIILPIFHNHEIETASIWL